MGSAELHFFPVKVDSVKFEGGSVVVVCSGEFGEGSGGNASALLIEEAIVTCLKASPERDLWEIVIDFASVDYVFSDGPLHAVESFLRRDGIKVKFLSSPQNDGPLRSLFGTCARDTFNVELG